MRRVVQRSLVQRRPEAAHLGNSMASVAFLSLLLAACAAAGTGPVADATRQQPAKAVATPTTQQKGPSTPVKTASAKAAPVKTAPVESASAKEAPATVPAQASPVMTSSLGSTKTANVVDLSYKPAVGSRWIAASEKRETKTRAGQLVESAVVRERGEYRITDKLAKGYRISYTLRDAGMEGNSPFTRLATPLIDSMKGQSFTFETDDSGTPVRLLDVARAKEVALNAIDMMAQTKPELASVPQLKQFIEGLRAQYGAATPETGVALFLEELLHYSLVQGLTDMPIGQEQSYDDEVTNPLFGAKMRSRASFKIAAVDSASGLATIEWRQTILPEDMNKATLEFVKRIVPNAEQDSKQFLDAMAQLKIDHLDTATYKIALADGVVRRMERTSVVNTQGSEKKTVLIMTMAPAP
jgi:hypothetical protein